MNGFIEQIIENNVDCLKPEYLKNGDMEIGKMHNRTLLQHRSKYEYIRLK